MDVIEAVVRALIKEGKLSRARALLSVFWEEYPNLVFELEEASGNYQAALEAFERMDEETKKVYEARAQKLKERLKREYRQDFRDAVAEMEKKNYEGAFALLEGITKDYPELVEAVALKLEIARRRGDRARVQSLEELLEALDPTHPALLQRAPKKKVSTFGAFEYTVVIMSAVILALSLMIMMSVPSKAFIKEEMGKIGSSKVSVDLKPLEEKIEKVRSDLEGAIGRIEVPEVVGIDEIEGVVRKVVKDELKGLKEDISKELSSIKITEGGTVSVDIEPLKNEIERLSRVVEEMKKKLDGYFAPPILPGEKVYKPSTKLDAAKIYWLAGYIMYLRNDFKSAVDLFRKSLTIIEVEFPHVYFHDDCFYYMALSYYMMGDYETAGKLFKELIREFPKSEYVDDAQLLLEKIGGGKS